MTPLAVTVAALRADLDAWEAAARGMSTTASDLADHPGAAALPSSVSPAARTALRAWVDRAVACSIEARSFADGIDASLRSTGSADDQSAERLGLA